MSAWTEQQVESARSAVEFLLRGEGAAYDAVLAAAGLTLDDIDLMNGEGLLNEAPRSVSAARPEPAHPVTPPEDLTVTLWDGVDLADPGLRAKVEDAVRLAPEFSALTEPIVLWPLMVKDEMDGVAPRIPVADARPNAHFEDLGPDAAPTRLHALDEAGRTKGLGDLVAFEQGRGRAVFAHLSPVTRRTRDAIARELGVDPWQVEILVSKDAVLVLRSPAMASSQRRLERWLEITRNRDILPVGPNERWVVNDEASTGRIYLRRTEDPLAKGFTLADFESTYRFSQDALSWERFPVAVHEDGTALDYTLFHTLIVGQTGAGKGSVLWSIISGLLPAKRAGLVKFFGIDPKNTEFKASANVFERVVREPEGWADIFGELLKEMEARQDSGGRSFEASVDRPLIVVAIDELAAVTAWDVDTGRLKEVNTNLNLLLSQARSAGIIFIAAVQDPTKEVLGKTRPFFGLKIALRTEKAADTNLVLGDDATNEGAESHRILVANAGNKYASAGIAYMRAEGHAGYPRVRFPFTPDAQLAAWNEEFAPKSSRPDFIEPEHEPESDVPVTDLGDLEFSLDDLEDDAVPSDLDDFDPFA